MSLGTRSLLAALLLGSCTGKTTRETGATDPDTPPTTAVTDTATMGPSTGSAGPGTGTFVPASDTATVTSPTPRICNGSELYCDRPYNAFATVCTHNAFANEVDGFVVPTPNQIPSFTTQLEDGVRCLMLDLYESGNELYLCHGLCGIWGQRKLVPALSEIDAWMRANPTEVVTFILESYIDESQVSDALTQAGLGQLVYRHNAPPGSPWPTLGTMIEREQRLVVFTDDNAANGNWHLDWDAYGWETPYNDSTFTCSDGRGSPDKPTRCSSSTTTPSAHSADVKRTGRSTTGTTSSSSVPLDAGRIAPTIRTPRSLPS